MHYSLLRDPAAEDVVPDIDTDEEHLAIVSEQDELDGNEGKGKKD